MKKLLLIALLIGVGLYNYKLIQFNGGIKVATNFKTSEDQTFVDQVSTMADINEIYYYDHPFGDDYITVINLDNEGLMVRRATENQIDALGVAGFFSNNLKPKEVAPTPIYFYGIALVLIVVLPYRGSKRY